MKNKKFALLSCIVSSVILFGLLGVAVASRNTAEENIIKRRQVIPSATEAPAPSSVPASPSESIEIPEVSSEEASSEVTPEEIMADGLIGVYLNAGEPEQERTTYAEGFYYEPLSDALIEFITGISYPAESASEGLTPAILPGDLSYLHILYYNFDMEPVEGELIVNKALAQDFAEIFCGLYEGCYPIEKVRLVDCYGGDDTLSMEDNNTSCFNYRNVQDSNSLSQHAYGRAIDINPFYNPYVVGDYISPAGSEIYTDRSRDFPYKIDKNDLCYKLFTEHGFEWGGNWKTMKDYQHFQKKR